MGSDCERLHPKPRPTGRVPRALSPVVGVVLLVAVTVVAAATLGATALSLEPGDAPPSVALAASADAADGRVTLLHRGGDALAVGSLDVRISVGGEPLRHQPPVPFVGAPGFEDAPTGPFNAASDDEWTAGERASLQVASTNRPTLSPGAVVEVQVYADDAEIADLQATA